jgi:hypothetical protein
MGGIAKFTAQAGYVYVNRAFVAFELIAPYRGKQFLTGADTASVEEKVLENAVFKGGEFQSLALEGNTAALLVKAEAVAADDALAVVRIFAAQYGTHAEHEFADIEGLYHVVVGPVFEADDAVNLFAAGSEHENGAGRRIAGTAVQFAANGKAVPPGEHEVEDDKVGLEFFSQLQSTETIGGLLHPVALVFQRKGHKFADIVVVFDYKYDRLFGFHASLRFRRV